MEPIKKLGRAAGSQRLTKMFDQRCQEICSANPERYGGGLDQMCDILQITRAQFRHRLSVDFETLKTGRWNGSRKIPFTGYNAAAAQLVEFEFEITR